MADETGVEYSCEFFDNAIASLEEGRDANSELRAVAIEAITERDSLQEIVNELEDTITTLRAEILEFNMQESY